MRHFPAVRNLLIGAVVTITPGCQDAGAPRREDTPATPLAPPVLAIEGPDTASDTVGARLPLRVTLKRDSAGLAGVSLLWRRLQPVGPGATTWWNVTSTDVQGVGTTTITLGWRACMTYLIEVSVPSLPATAPVRFVVSSRPGRPTQLDAVGLGYVDPRDSSVVVPTDSTAEWFVWAMDSHGDASIGMRGNPHDGGVELSVVTSDSWSSVSPSSAVTRQPERTCGAGARFSFTGASTAGRQQAFITAELPGNPRVPIRLATVDRMVDVRGDLFDLRFSPDSIEIPAGKTVGWRWACLTPLTETGCPNHNVTFEDAPSPPESTTDLETGMAFARTFATPGMYRYRCTRHSTSFTEGMVGVVLVR